MFFEKLFAKPKKYKVKLIGNSKVMYSEGDHEVIIESERLFGDVDLIIYLSSLKFWLPPNDREPITDEDKLRVKANISEELMRRKFVVDWG